MLNSLEKREADILRMRFGLECHDTLTLEELGAKFRVTRERVRQLQNMALKKIRKLMVRNEAQRSRADIELDEFQAAFAAGAR
jgi:RNA polymerase primary sigma factor